MTSIDGLINIGDPDLYNAETGQITEQGMAILTDVIAGNGKQDPTRQSIINELAGSTTLRREAQEATKAARGELERRVAAEDAADKQWAGALAAAVAFGSIPRTRIAEEAGISRARLYQIIDATPGVTS